MATSPAAGRPALPLPAVTSAVVNTPPSAGNDSYSVNEGQSLVVASPGVLSNDVDTDGDTLTVHLVSSPSHGTLSLQSNGSFVYNHDGSETTSDSFTYRAEDGNGGVSTATVSITVQPTNDPPVAVNDSYTIIEGGTLIIQAPGVLSNDSDVDSVGLTVSLRSSPSHGSLNLQSDGRFTYTHNGGQATSDSFEYDLSDGQGGVDTARVTISISPVNDPPVGVNDSYTVDEGGTLNVLAPGVLDSDFDPDGDLLNATLVSGTTNGTLQLNSNGSFNYTHDGGESTVDQFTYQVDDFRGGVDTAVVTINITPVNDPPVANVKFYSVTEGQTLNVNAPGVLDNDTDADGDTLTSTLVSGPSHGTLQLNSNGSFSYAHGGGENTSDQFTYRVSDQHGGTDTAVVSLNILPANDPPVAGNDAYSVTEGQTLNVNAPGVLDNDNDVDGDALTVVLLTGPSHGSLQLNANGSFSYAHGGGENTSDQFTYRVSDQRGGTDTAVVSLNILPANDPPVAGNDAYSVTEGQTLNVNAPGVLNNDSDVDGDALTVVLLAGPSHGSLQLNANGSFSYAHGGGENTSDQFTYRVSDQRGGTDTAVVSLNILPANDPPVAGNDAYSVTEGQTLNINAPGVLNNEQRCRRGRVDRCAPLRDPATGHCNSTPTDHSATRTGVARTRRTSSPIESAISEVAPTPPLSRSTLFQRMIHPSRATTPIPSTRVKP